MPRIEIRPIGVTTSTRTVAASVAGTSGRSASTAAATSAAARAIAPTSTSPRIAPISQSSAGAAESGTEPRKSPLASAKSRVRSSGTYVASTRSRSAIAVRTAATTRASAIATAAGIGASAAAAAVPSSAPPASLASATSSIARSVEAGASGASGIERSASKPASRRSDALAVVPLAAASRVRPSSPPMCGAASQSRCIRSVAASRKRSWASDGEYRSRIDDSNRSSQRDRPASVAASRKSPSSSRTQPQSGATSLSGAPATAKWGTHTGPVPGSMATWSGEQAPAIGPERQSRVGPVPKHVPPPGHEPPVAQRVARPASAITSQRSAGELSSRTQTRSSATSAQRRKPVGQSALLAQAVVQ